jgi:ParB family chromosome partitioning protein
MAEETMKSRLGRGLAALIGDVGEESAANERERARSPRRVPIEFLRANPRNPRRTFVEEELDELAASIRERGIIQPILVRSIDGLADNYEIIAGERRWRAAQRAGLHEVPVVIVEVSDREALELAIIENVQRSDLNPIEEAMGYSALIDEFGYSHEDVARIVGKSRPHVANTVRLLKLSEKVKGYIQTGRLTPGHARLLIGQPNADELAEEIVTRGLNVRQVEARIRVGIDPRLAARGGRPRKDPDTEALEARLTDVLGLKVRIEHRENGGGAIRVEYRTLEQLDDIVRRLESGGEHGRPWESAPRMRSL